MAAKPESATLQQLVETFTDVSAHTKKLDKVIEDFGEIMEEFRETLLYIDEKMSVTTLASFSKEALARLKEIKEFNDFQVIDQLNSSLAKQFEEQRKIFRKESREDSNSEHTLARIESQLNGMAMTLNSMAATPEKKEAHSPEELWALLEKINQQTRNHQYTQPVMHPDPQELAELKKEISHLTSRLNKLEEHYEAKIFMLEAEIISLKEN